MAIIADEEDPLIRVVVGGEDVARMVDHRWQMYTKRGMPTDHTTLITTIGGSYTYVPGWEPAGDDVDAAVAEAQRILDEGSPLPGALVVP